MKKQLLYATTNPGKIFEIRKYLKQFGISVVAPKDLGLSLTVPETGETLEENAVLKAKAYLKAGVDGLVMADDTGIEIDALHGAPGIHAGRWKDGKTRMSDQEIIDYCLMRMRGISKEKRTAKFRTVIAVGSKREEIKLFDGILIGMILEKPIPLRIEGFPFESLFYIPEWRMALGEVHQLPIEQKRGFLTHRERAIQKALPRLRPLL